MASAPTSPDRTSYFIITGFPKSGNKWLQTMLVNFGSIGGYHRRPERGVPLLARPVVDHRELHEVLRRDGIAFEDFFKRLYHPAAPVPLRFSPAGRQAMEPVLAHLSLEASRLAGRRVPPERFGHLMADPPRRGTDEPAAFGTAGMHVPVGQLQELLPSFHVINLRRDPRDVVVSFFYHTIGTLHPPIARDYVRVTRSGELVQRPDWMQRFANRFMRRVESYYALPPVHRDRLHDVRYEDLLSDAGGELRPLLDTLGCVETEATIAEIVHSQSFAVRTGTTGEVRGAAPVGPASRIIRKGQAGDWVNYFDRTLVETLGPRFLALVREQGYETDDTWARRVPETAPKNFEFSRFRIRRSTTRAFVRYWDQSEELQRRYPSPWDIEHEDSFYGWLCSCPHRDVQEWLELARRLETHWAVDIVEASQASASQV